MAAAVPGSPRSICLRRWRSSVVSPVVRPHRSRPGGPTCAASRRDTELVRDRADRRPLRGVLALVLEHQPDGPLAQLLRIATPSHATLLQDRVAQESNNSPPENRGKTGASRNPTLLANSSWSVWHRRSLVVSVVGLGWGEVVGGWRCRCVRTVSRGFPRRRRALPGRRSRRDAWRCAPAMSSARCSPMSSSRSCSRHGVVQRGHRPGWRWCCSSSRASPIGRPPMRCGDGWIGSTRWALNWVTLALTPRCSPSSARGCSSMARPSGC